MMRIPLSEIDAGFIGIQPIFTLVRLETGVAPDLLRTLVASILPSRFSGHLVQDGGQPFIEHIPDCFGFRHCRLDDDIFPDGKTLNIPKSRLAQYGLTGSIGLNNPLLICTLIDGPSHCYLGVALSHAAGDAYSLGLFARKLVDLIASRPSVPTETKALPDRSDEQQNNVSLHGFYSQLRMRKSTVEHLESLRREHPELSRHALRTAYLLQKLHPYIGSQEKELRVRIPIDLRFRRLGLNLDKLGNCFVDTFFSVPAHEFQAVSVPGLAKTIGDTIENTVSDITRDDLCDVEHQSVSFRRKPANQGFAPLSDIICTSFRTGPRYVLGLPAVPLSIMDSISKFGSGTTTCIEVVSLLPLPEHVYDL